MRRIALPACAALACTALAACSGDPSAYGITGPGVHAVPPPEAQSTDGVQAGTPQAGTGYGATLSPTRGPSGFWGYNN